MMSESRQVRLKQRNASQYLKGGIVFLLCAAWLLFAVFYWSQKFPFYRTATCLYLDWVKSRLDSPHFFSVSVYLHLAPFILLTHLLSVSLPKCFKDGKTPVLYRIIAALLIFCSLLMMIAACTDLPALTQPLIPARITAQAVLFSDAWYLWLSPVCVTGEIIAWIICGLSKKKKKADSFFMSVLLLIFSIFAGVLSAALSCLLLAAVQDLLPSAVSMVEDFCHTLASSPSMFYASLILAPVIEETAFRGLIQEHLSGYFPAVLSIFPASLAFGLWHRNIGQFVYTFLFGIISGSLYHMTGKLRYSILMHFTLNLSAILAFSDSQSCILGYLPAMSRIYPFLMSFGTLQAVGMVCGILVVLYLCLRFVSKHT